jgi:hypothetical protein
MTSREATSSVNWTGAGVARQRAVGTQARIDGLDRQPDGINHDHASQLRNQAAHWSAADIG